MAGKRKRGRSRRRQGRHHPRPPQAAESQLVTRFTRADRMFLVVMVVHVATYALTCSVALAFDAWSWQISESAAAFWDFDVPSSGTSISRSIVPMAAIGAGNIALLGFIYHTVRGTGDVINHSGLDLQRMARGEEPTQDVAPVELRSFVRSIVAGGWIGALGVALYGLATRDLEALVYGPVLGVVFGSLLIPGVTNFFLVHRQKS